MVEDPEGRYCGYTDRENAIAKRGDVHTDEKIYAGKPFLDVLQGCYKFGTG